MMIDRGQKVDNKMLDANIKLIDSNKALKYDIEVLEEKIKSIKEICEIVYKTYPESKAFASRILFIIDNKKQAE